MGEEKNQMSQETNRKKKKNAGKQKKPQNSLPVIPKVPATGQLVYGSYITIF